MEKTGLVTVPFLDIHVNLKDEPQWLWAIVAVSTLCFVVSAVFLYLSRKQILDIVEKQYARSLEQLGLLSLRVPDPRVPVASHIFHGPRARRPHHGMPARRLHRDHVCHCHDRRSGRFGRCLLPLQDRSAAHAADRWLGRLGRVVPLSVDASSGEKRQGRGEGTPRDAGGGAQAQ